MRGAGTLINVGLVVFGSVIGLGAGHRVPERARTTLLHVIGLVTIAIGVSDAIDTHNMVFPLVGMAAGALIGEALRLEERVAAVGGWLERRVSARRPDAESTDQRTRFVTGFVTASALYCIGPLTILGALQDASGETPQLYIIKGLLDGFVSIMFAATYGIGVAFSALSVLVVQGSLTIAGGALDAVLDDRMRRELFAAGGLAVIGIGFNLLGVTKIRLASLLPGLVLTPVLVALFAR
ncbi:MAG: DUF554 domain-containing protein [Ilumatobacteraceae bacterium]